MRCAPGALVLLLALLAVCGDQPLDHKLPHATLPYPPPPNLTPSLLAQWRRKTHAHFEDGVGSSQRIDCQTRDALSGETAQCLARALQVLQQYSDGRQHIALVLTSGVCMMDEASVLMASQVCSEPLVFISLLFPCPSCHVSSPVQW
jgi:hypothetical protein